MYLDSCEVLETVTKKTENPSRTGPHLIVDLCTYLLIPFLYEQSSCEYRGQFGLILADIQSIKKLSVNPYISISYEVFRNSLY